MNYKILNSSPSRKQSQRTNEERKKLQLKANGIMQKAQTNPKFFC